MQLAICARHELEEHESDAETLLISVQNSYADVSDLKPKLVKDTNWLLLRFSDVTSPTEPDAPTAKAMVQLFDWLHAKAASEELNDATKLIVHCDAGISRSPAVACVAISILALQHDYEAAMGLVAESASSGYIWPNELVIELADGLLRAEGALIAAVAAWKKAHDGLVW